MSSATLPQLLAERARVHGPRTFLIHPASGARLSYADMDVWSARAAAILKRRGVGRGDRVLLSLPNGPEFFFFLFGAAKRGAVAVPLAPGLKPAELEQARAHCAPKVLIDAAFAAALASEPDAPVPDEACRPDDPLLILYTSGSSGAPKGAVHSHASVLAKLQAISEGLSFTADDVSVCMLPVYFGHALIANSLSLFYAGGALVLCPPFGVAEISRMWTEAAAAGATTFSAVPSVLKILLQLKGRLPGPGPRLRFVTCASAPLAPELAADFQKAYGVPVLNCYGMTEAASWIAAEGKPLGCELRLLEETGEILVRGPSLMQGYYRRPDLTAQAIVDGWLHTGDQGRFDAAGRLFITGRLKDIIIRNGLNIQPAEVDEALRVHPGVADSATIGVPDPLLGERVISYVVLKTRSAADATGLIAHCRGILADHKCPERVLFLEAIPRDERGKLRKQELPPP